MLKKIVLSTLIMFYGSTFHASISDFFYSAHCAGAEYYELAKKNNSKDFSLLKDAHIYTTALLVHILFPFYFFTSPIAMGKVTEQNLVQCGKNFGKIAHASFIVPALGAFILSCIIYFSAKKIIHLIKS